MTADIRGNVQLQHSYKPHAKQLEVHESGARFKVLNTGRRYGKSTLAINTTLKAALQKLGRYWIIGPTYRQIKSIYWNSLLKEYIPDEIIKRKNESELYIELVNGSFIEFKGAEDPDKLRGARLDGVVLDEYAFMRPVVWEEHIQPMIRESGGWAVFISTPNGFNHFYDLTEFSKKAKNTDWEYFHYTAYDNPYFPKVEIDKAKAETSPEMFAQEYLGDFTKRAGLVFPEFEQAIHVTKEPIQPDSKWAHYRSIDFGQTNPTAVLWAAIDPQGNIWVYDEVYQKGMSTSELAHIIKAKSPHFITMTYGDSASAQSIRDLSEYGIYVSPIKKTTGASGEDYIKAGVEKIKQFLKIQEGTGKPKLFISPQCQNLIFEFMNYSWQEEKEDINQPERPQKFNDHALDALRYFIYEYTRPVKKVAKPYVPADSLTGY